jgi:hypothetical protein
VTFGTQYIPQVPSVKVIIATTLFPDISEGQIRSGLNGLKFGSRSSDTIKWVSYLKEAAIFYARN